MLIIHYGSPQDVQQWHDIRMCIGKDNHSNNKPCRSIVTCRVVVDRLINLSQSEISPWRMLHLETGPPLGNHSINSGLSSEWASVNPSSWATISSSHTEAWFHMNTTSFLCMGSVPVVNNTRCLYIGDMLCSFVIIALKKRCWVFCVCSRKKCHAIALGLSSINNTSSISKAKRLYVIRAWNHVNSGTDDVRTK